MSLLYDDNDHDDLELPSFGVNKAFAEKYETKKRGEELSKRTSIDPQTRAGACQGLEQVLSQLTRDC